jgi:hypothetical protein
MHGLVTSNSVTLTLEAGACYYLLLGHDQDDISSQHPMGTCSSGLFSHKIDLIHFLVFSPFLSQDICGER